MSEHIEALQEHLNRKGFTDMETQAHIGWIQQENAELRKDKERLDWLLEENNKLRKDKERLDWLLDEDSCTHIERGRYNRFRDWLVKTLHNRSDIDREMETYDFNEIIREEELTNEY